MDDDDLRVEFTSPVKGSGGPWEAKCGCAGTVTQMGKYIKFTKQCQKHERLFAESTRSGGFSIGR